MKTKAAVLWGLHQKWEVEEVDLDGPKQNEVLVKLTASGLCHSDDHLVTGDMPMQLPVVGGHEGAGVVVEVGPGVTDVAEGDPVVLSFIPACGRCEPCARGMSNLCVLGAAIIAGPQLDGTFRFHARGQDLGQMCVLGTFSEYTVVPVSSLVKVDPSIALDTAALVGCGVTTGYGSAVRTGETRDGDVVVVMGVGGIGINAVQGARIAGARVVLALDPVEYKRSRSREFGATHTAATVEEAAALLTDVTHGAMADVCVVSTDVAEGRYVAQALRLVGKRGRVVMTAIPHPTDMQVDMSLFDLTLYEKQVRGSLFGSSNPRRDIPRLLDLHGAGQLKLDELVTREYTLEEINQGYADMHAGINLRGLIRF
ncbi:NDMA-dependent alcohol dehydrogenase [Mycobacterium sp. CVI_P3]|uniref:alcohol dehydrogenase n=1 Tax=Mycobacterium pinniadriaticum TaxID=2994102 RepID=A0ABT3SDT7_9MYCO|nr:NDMA-dependent alcohol dehydrogenase [Mycobacterium pinniadriaticum]MCX2931109.1 NDMA-dependent alcohol dehydrogenase [Mycobacterium pinniadriaticum]MCX2937667.1 NDMA-dependent alcohol dehydrogenase [Mycobacterium pinniadriaticum]